MKLAFAHRKTLAALIVVPAIALTGIVAETATGLSDAQAQQRQSRGPVNVGPGPNEDGGGDGGNGPIIPVLRPCPPGLTAVPGANCRPWTPPAQTAESEEDCTCRIVYKMVDGRRVPAKDCYVLLPNQKVHYCTNPGILR